MLSLKSKTNRRLEEKEYEPTMTTRVVGFFLIVLVTFPMLSLYSYDWHDIPWLATDGTGIVRNWVGLAGAIGTCAGYSIFGLGIWLLPIWMLLFGSLMVSDRMPHPWRKFFWALLLQSCISALIETGGFAETCARLNLKTPGGAIGWFMATKCLRPILGRVGGTQILIVLALTALAFGVGLRNWMAFFKWLVEKVRAWRAARDSEEVREAREEIRRLKEEARAAKQAEKERLRAEREAEREERRREKEERQRAKEEERAAREREYEEQKERLRLEREAAEERRRAAREEAERQRAGELPLGDESDTSMETEAPRSDSGAEADMAAPHRGAGPSTAESFTSDGGAALHKATGSSTAGSSPSDGGAARRQPEEEEKPYELPLLSLLSPIPDSQADCGDTTETAMQIAATLSEFRVPGEITHVEEGPVITTYEFLPAQRIRPEQVAAMDKTLEMRIKAKSLRIEAPIPGKGVCGIEVPNKVARPVTVREVLEGDTWKAAVRKLKLPLLLGKDASGHDLVVDMADMPHLLVAGATGSGKSVCMNAILTGLLMSRTPEELKLILVDPKVVEFAGYKEIPHLVVPVITDPKKVALGLVWAIHEMERRYKMLSEVGVKNIASFNERKRVPVQQDMFEDNLDDGNAPQIPDKLPYILIVIDEMADLMLQVKREIEDGITRLAQKSRAVGIHLILATQRPTVNIVTGTIKANIAGRIAFQVAQKNDSKTIIDRMGAESLIGRGDMLFLNPRTGKTIRAQGAFITDGDAEAVTAYIRSQAKPKYSEEAQRQLEAATGDDAKGKGGAQSNGAEAPRPDMSASVPNLGGNVGEEAEDGLDPLYQDAIAVIRRTRRASTSSLQRALGIGYGRAARIFDQLEERGIVGPSRGALPREILIDLDGEIPTGGADPSANDE